MPQCNICQEYLDTWPELAKHVLEHDAHNKWALAFLSKAQILNQKRDLPQRTALTEEQREAKEDCQRELSGQTTLTKCLCPRCNKTRLEWLPIEHLSSGQAWKTNTGHYFIFCPNCQN